MVFVGSDSTATSIYDDCDYGGTTATTTGCNDGVEYEVVFMNATSDASITNQYRGWAKARYARYINSTYKCTAVMNGIYTDIEDNWTKNCTATLYDSVSYSRYIRKTGCQWVEFVWEDGKVCAPSKTPAERLRDIIQSRHAPAILVSRKPLLTPDDIREVRARETLCRVLGEDKFQRFLKDGFVTVRGKSGLVYQIFPGHGITNVYREGEQVERLCVVLRGDFPPTDSLIMRYLIILNDEARFRGYAVKHTVITKSNKVAASDDRNLVEIFKGLKETKKVA